MAYDISGSMTGHTTRTMVPSPVPLQRCPCCLYTYVELRVETTTDATLGTIAWWNVHCNMCHLDGHVLGRREAIASWNAMSRLDRIFRYGGLKDD